MATQAIFHRCTGFTLLELLIAMSLAALLLASVAGIVNTAYDSKEIAEERNNLQREARFAMGRMVMAAGNSSMLLLPLADDPATNWREHVREQTVPPSPPEGDSTNATAVLAMTLPIYSDLDADGFPDADNDRDGHLDEDTDNDRNNDFDDGVYLIDDDGDGSVDEGFLGMDDDEDGPWDEDNLNGIDDDADGTVDEDTGDDRNGDGCPGICGVDDDGDGNTDEGDARDDDEDGSTDEDWYDLVVFYLDGDILKERLSVPWDESGIGGITGRDFVTSELADNITRLRIERLPVSSGGEQLVDITLEITGDTGEFVSLQTRIRLGAAL